MKRAGGLWLRRGVRIGLVGLGLGMSALILLRGISYNVLGEERGVISSFELVMPQSTGLHLESHTRKPRCPSLELGSIE